MKTLFFILTAAMFSSIPTAVFAKSSGSTASSHAHNPGKSSMTKEAKEKKAKKADKKSEEKKEEAPK